jgi:phage terminase large subunit-like protein
MRCLRSAEVESLQSLVSDSRWFLQQNPQGVVFMGNGRTEQGHNAIAEHLIDGPS